MFDLYPLLNEINIRKKQLIFLTISGNEEYNLLHNNLCRPRMDKMYDELKNMR